jgi:hypothetical protein
MPEVRNNHHAAGKTCPYPFAGGVFRHPSTGIAGAAVCGAAS